MTSDMCGIETTNVKHASARRTADGYRRQPTPRLGAVARRVPPLQGWNGLVGPSSQGDALGWRIIAPLARKTGTARAWVNVTRWLAQFAVLSPVSQPEGLQLVSPGQRPGNSAKNNMVSPERATPGNARAQAPDLEQTIAGNVAEILEA